MISTVMLAADKKWFYIYALVDPRNDEVRYIGRTINPRNRYWAHLVKDNRNDYKRNWVKSLLNKNLRPKYEIIWITDNVGEANQAEIYFIKMYKEGGARLTNLTEGGEGALGRITSENTKREI